MTLPAKIIERPRDSWQARPRVNAIDSAHTRAALIWALEAAALNPDLREFRTGVLPT